MKLHLAPLLLATHVILTAATSAADAPQPSFPAHTIPNSQLRVLPRNAVGRHYQLHIGLPASYAKETGQRYPVVFVTGGYWDFVKITSAEGGLVYDKLIPEFITAGLGYAGEDLDYGVLRRWELSPAPFGDAGAGPSGHAADFLRTIETEIIPFVEREYRVDSSYRVLAGASLGGLFTLYSMYTKQCTRNRNSSRHASPPPRRRRRFPALRRECAQRCPAQADRFQADARPHLRAELGAAGRGRHRPEQPRSKVARRLAAQF